MIRGHPNGNQNLEVDDMIFVEFVQQRNEKIKQKHADGQAADVCVTLSLEADKPILNDE